MPTENSLQIIAAEIKNNALKKLPGIEAHKAMLPQGRSMPEDYLNKIENYKKSAVFALLFDEQEQINMILTERHQYEGKHSGQISFPGGKKEEDDEDLLHTAYRETYEEIGIHKHQIKFISALSPLYIPVSNFYVQPYLGYLEQLPQFLINQREVKNIVKFPLKELKNPNIVKLKKIETSSGIPLTAPAFEYNNHIIWGATAMMLNEISELIKSLKV